MALISDAPAGRVIGLRGVAQLMAQMNLVGGSRLRRSGRLRSSIVPLFSATVITGDLADSLIRIFLVILPSQSLRGDRSMTQETVQIIAGVLAVLLIGIVIMRRKSKKKTQEDEF